MFANKSSLRRLVLIVALAVVALTGATGCDLLGTGLGSLGFGFGSYGLFDPTDTIQSVLDYRWDVMDFSNDAWNDYILQ